MIFRATDNATLLEQHAGAQARVGKTWTADLIGDPTRGRAKPKPHGDWITITAATNRTGHRRILLLHAQTMVDASGHAESTARTAHGRLPHVHVTPTKLDLGTLGHSSDYRPHQLADGCGPSAVLSCSRCGPFAVRRPTNSREHERIQPREAQRFRGSSPMFAGLRGSLTNRGERLELAFLSRFRGACGPICGPHTASIPGFLPVEAGRMPSRTHVC